MSLQASISRMTEISHEANKFIAGGVVSLNRKVSPAIIFKRGKGSKIYDVDGKEYIDYHAAFAPHLLGHNNDAVNSAVTSVISDEWSLFGSGTNELEVQLSELLCRSVPSLELVQITNTGSEATAHAIRLSRAYTGREDIILMLGGYNGWHNEVARIVMPSLEHIGARITGEYPFLASSAGIPEGTKGRVHIVNFNDLESVELVLQKYPVACILTEPVLQNIGVVLPQPGYLQGLINLCEQYGALCVFDEVKTGFRTALGGYQSVAGVVPHLSVFGKAVANGYPLGVIGGRRDIMELFDAADPAKRVLIAGTYNAHPVNTAAAIATLQILQHGEVYKHLEQASNDLYSGLEQIFATKGISCTLVRNGSAFCPYFMDKAPADLHDILLHHQFELDLRLRKALIDRGIYHIPIPCKQGSVSYAHSKEDINRTLEITEDVVRTL
ncbi:MAG TPA: aspartate aminotransferase family protein [Chitinophagaceae bacterium]|nr:aspartate aminotransferase family protein [Chitinophagaceae bacterium]